MEGQKFATYDGKEMPQEFDKGLERIAPIHDAPNELESDWRILNQFKRGYEPLMTFSMPTMIFSIPAVMGVGGPVMRAGILSSNLGPTYGARKVMNSNSRQNEIDRELEKWQLYENDFDLSLLFEEAEPVRGFETSEMMQDSYESFQEDFEEMGLEIQDLTDSDVYDDTFAEDQTYALQAVRFEEDDFGTVEFQVNMYLSQDEVAIYHGQTKDRQTVDSLKEEGLTAEENKGLLSNYFDLPNGLEVRYTLPDDF